MNHSRLLSLFGSRAMFAATLALIAAAPLMLVVGGVRGWGLWVAIAMLALGILGITVAYTELRMALASYVIRNNALRADLNNERARAAAFAADSDSRSAALAAEVERVKGEGADRLRALDALCARLTADLDAARQDAARSAAEADVARQESARFQAESQALREEIAALRAEARAVEATAAASGPEAEAPSLDRHERTIAAMLTFANECVLEKERYRKGLLRLSVANKREELHHRISASDLEADSANLFRHFDAAFIALYPDFIRRFNDRLYPADRLNLRPDGTMPTELRAIALMRLGITDSKTIAQLLNISVATVYNYRSRYKARLAPTSPLESAIRAL